MRAYLLASLALLLAAACDGEAAPADAATPDGGISDAGARIDAGTTADGDTDAGHVDAGHVDAGTDAGRPDAGTDAGPPICAESPCRLVSPQCGCPAGERCTIDDDALPHCAPDGTAGEGESCAVADCAAGFVCAGRGIPTCQRFCEDDEDCISSAGSQCLYDFGGPRACSIGCDPVHDTGCPLGSGCTVLRTAPGGPGFTDCRPAGSVATGEPCASEEECQGGHLCVPVDGVRQCVRWCKRTTDCPVDQGCIPYGDLTIGADEFGYCA